MVLDWYGVWFYFPHECMKSWVYRIHVTPVANVYGV